jgi:hypothetical protein
MFSSGGVRHELSVMNYVKAENKILLYDSYRIGPTAVRFLQSIVPEMQSKANHDTLFEIIPKSTFDNKFINDLVDTHNYNTIITPYAHNVKLVQKAVENTKWKNYKIVKTHAY